MAVPMDFDAAASDRLPGPTWLQARRSVAAGRFSASALPTTAEEVWRYSRIAELDLDVFAPVVDGDEPADLPAELQATVDAVGAAAATVVVRNGRVVRVDADPALVEGGLVVGRLTELDPDGAS